MDVGVNSTSKVIVINRTSNDDFGVNHAPHMKKNELHNTEGDKGESNPRGKVHVIFNESLHWKNSNRYLV